MLCRGPTPIAGNSEDRQETASEALGWQPPVPAGQQGLVPLTGDLWQSGEVSQALENPLGG